MAELVEVVVMADVSDTEVVKIPALQTEIADALAGVVVAVAVLAPKSIAVVGW